MNKTVVVPTSLVEAIRYFADPDVALATFAAFRWPDGEAVCPACQVKASTFLATRRIWKCKACKKQFSAKVGTVFEDSPLPLSKWLPALWMCVNSKNGISSCELARALKITQKSAWFMLARIRLALHHGRIDRFSGHVEADETYIGGKAKFMHRFRKWQKKQVRAGMGGKAVVHGLLQRSERKGHSRVQAAVIASAKRKDIRARVEEGVAFGSNLYTDDLPSYLTTWRDYQHRVINHAVRYVDGKIHTNGLENFWSLLKRAIKGTYVSVEPFHLFRYLDEQVYRFNNRNMKDVARFVSALAGLIGKRLTYANLIGATT